ncbi:toll/interleukin-1 receptor domain-containing protein [Neptunomonas antarctica]|uniref:TIR domain-containing protein n=1 Tax=Neptunomonas antarctica TaxID=619304 RepID=A0A1N7KGX3_9GAMM|nr:toll/interleukin-1 receptor domain-containing protein [Neptunomonas antarctica]SIS60852.1 TIR domain-containing protein [Neptunomonas antarctica]
MPTEDNKPSYDVFISYAGPDEDAAKSLCEELEKQGLQCWIAPRNVRAGNKYLEEILEGVIRSKCLLLLLSENTKFAEYVENEVERAKSYRRRIYTVRLEEVAVPKNLELILGSTQWVDSWAADYPERLQQIVANVKQTDQPGFSPTPPGLGLKLFRILRKNTLGIATVGILLFFVVKFFYSSGLSNMPSALDGISDVSVEDFQVKINHYELGDSYRINFTPIGVGLASSLSLITKQYYYNLKFDNGTSVREINGLVGAQIEIPEFDEVPLNVTLILEDLDGEKSAPLHYAIPQLPYLIEEAKHKRIKKLITLFNKSGTTYCSPITPFYAGVKACYFGSFGQGKKYQELLSYINYFSYGEQKNALINRINLQTLDTQGVAGYKLNDSNGTFEFFIPMTDKTHFYQVEYINGEKSPVFSLNLSSPNDGNNYHINSSTPDAIPLFLLQWLPTSPLLMVAATDSNVTALDWQIYPNVNNAFTPVGTWYHSPLSDGLNSQETVKLIATHKDGSVSEFQYSLNFNTKLNDQRLTKNKQQTKNLFQCNSYGCVFSWLQATQEDVDTIEDILIGVKSDRLVSITKGDINLLTKDAEKQRLAMLADEEARPVKKEKQSNLSFGTPVNSRDPVPLVERLRLPIKFEVRKDWKIREKTRTSRFISYSLPLSPLFIQFKWIDGSYSKVMVVQITKDQ